jgi:hypothetical protein
VAQDQLDHALGPALLRCLLENDREVTAGHGCRRLPCPA